MTWTVEQQRAYNRAYYMRRREELLARNRERVREWAKAHPEAGREHRRRYRRRHPDVDAHRQRTRYARKKATAVSRVTREDLMLLMEAQRGRCAYCGGVLIEPQLDHVVALARGGTHEVGNLAWACAKCNREKGTLDAEVFRERIKAARERALREDRQGG